MSPTRASRPIASAWRTVATALLVALFSGCGPSMLIVRDEHEALRVRVQQAKSLGAMACAPQELAQAQASWRFAELELQQADAARAADHIRRGEAAVATAISAGQSCGVRAQGPMTAARDVTLDADGDGVVGEMDRCPYEIEDRDRFADEDGCPDPDNDHDGLPDGQDRCPNEAEDRDGHQDEDGCPDPDNDGDGVLDAQDRCPEKMETKNDFDDGDGCPDFRFQLVAINGDKVVLPRAIQFADGSSALPPDALPALKELGQWLVYEGGLRLAVESHTDNKGEPALLRLLSQARADAVRAALVAEGVAVARIEAKGWGTEKPLATNRTEAGRTQNRRVELTVLPPAP